MRAGPPPGIYQDPNDPDRQRYWDGTSWGKRLRSPGEIDDSPPEALGGHLPAITEIVEAPSSIAAAQRKAAGNRTAVAAVIVALLALGAASSYFWPDNPLSALAQLLYYQIIIQRSPPTGSWFTTFALLVLLPYRLAEVLRQACRHPRATVLFLAGSGVEVKVLEPGDSTHPRVFLPGCVEAHTSFYLKKGLVFFRSRKLTRAGRRRSRRGIGLREKDYSGPSRALGRGSENLWEVLEVGKRTRTVGNAELIAILNEAVSEGA